VLRFPVLESCFHLSFSGSFPFHPSSLSTWLMRWMPPKGFSHCVSRSSFVAVIRTYRVFIDPPVSKFPPSPQGRSHDWSFCNGPSLSSATFSEFLADVYLLHAARNFSPAVPTIRPYIVLLLLLNPARRRNLTVGVLLISFFPPGPSSPAL